MLFRQQNTFYKLSKNNTERLNGEVLHLKAVLALIDGKCRRFSSELVSDINTFLCSLKTEVWKYCFSKHTKLLQIYCQIEVPSVDLCFPKTRSFSPLQLLISPKPLVATQQMNPLHA